MGVDTGGTFTDFVFASNGKLDLFKLPSTPSDPSLAIQAGLQRISATIDVPLAEIEVIHGTTVGTRAVQRRGAHGARHDEGIRGRVVIGRQARPSS